MSSWLGAVICALGLTASCRQVAGIDDREAGPAAPSDFVGQCGGFHYQKKACAECMDRQCCDVTSGCAQSPHCEAHVACSVACDPTDPACAARCAWRFGAVGSSLVNACRARACSAECGTTCGGPEYPRADCVSCVASSCCAESAACQSDDDCVKLAACIRGCVSGSPTCPPACQAQYPKGVPSYDALRTCRDKSCGAACKPGTAWGCLDDPVPTLVPKTFDPVKLHGEFADFVTFDPWVGLQFKVCPPLDFECKSPSDSNETDASGAVDLNLPLTPKGFDGYLDVSGSTAYPGIYEFAFKPVEAVGIDLRWPTAGAFNAMSTIVGVKPDPTRGYIGGNTRDCAGELAGGVSMSVDTLDSATTPFYFAGSVPSKTATATDTATAIGGFANLPTGLARVDYRLAADARPVGQVTVLVRAGTLTFVDLPPLP